MESLGTARLRQQHSGLRSGLALVDGGYARRRRAARSAVGQGGRLAGWIASMVTGRNRQMGILANIVVGIVGGLLGGWIMKLATGEGLTGFSLRSFLVALGGAIILLFIVNAFRRERRTT